MKPFLFSFVLAGVASAASLDELIPRLADPVVTNRYAAQMELQALAADAAKPGNEAARLALSKQLAAKAADAAVPQPARVWIVRQLEHIGRGEAVPALCALLRDADAELRECARRALEKNPDAKAVDCLRSALRQATDPVWKIGLVHSLGERRDAQAVPLIVPLLSDAQVGGAAAKALGEIATPEAVKALWRVFDSQPMAAEALVSAAARLNSVAIARELYRRSQSSAVRAAALSVLGGRDPKLVEEALLGQDVRLQKAAVDVSSPAALAALLPRMPATAKVFALRVVDSERAALQSFTDSDESVRVAALEAMGRIGTAYSVPALIKASASGTEAEKTAANASLAVVNGRGAAEAIERQAQQGEAAARVAAINALAARFARNTVPALLRYAAEPDAAVSKAALAAVGKLGSDESLEPLVALVLENRAGAKEALQAVASRSANKSAVAQKLIAQAQKTAGGQVSGVLEVLALVGGPEALTAVSKLAASTNDEVKDAAIRALCQWREFAAVTPLLEIAGAAGVKQVHNVLAVQAVCRLVRSSESVAPEARVKATLDALKAAQRPQEKKQAVAALASVKHRKAADALLGLMRDSELKTEAAQAALSLADALRKSDRGMAVKLAKAVKQADVSPDLNKKAEQSLKKK